MALESYQSESEPTPEKKQEDSEQALAELSQDVQQDVEQRESSETAEAPQESSPEAAERAAEKALERDQKSEAEIDRLDGSDITAGTLKMKLVQEPATVEYIEQTGHEELQRGYEALVKTTHEEIDRALEAQGEVQESATGQAEG